MKPRLTTLLLIVTCSLTSFSAAEGGAKPSAKKTKRVLLIGQGPDGHPWNSHEYLAGLRILASCLQDVPQVQTILVKADEPWKQGPELLDGADVAVVFVSQGAKWLQQDPKRLAAFQQFAKRGGGLVVIHWGMGCREAKYIEKFTDLFGGCHGGPDRKYKVLTVGYELANTGHPILRGVKPLKVHEEFYYTLKFTKRGGTMTPLIRVPIDGETHTVGWAWNRPDGGRSFGFSGGHFHENWKHDSYRRMLTQAVLWTADTTPPKDGLALKYKPSDLTSPRPKPAKKKG